MPPGKTMAIVYLRMAPVSPCYTTANRYRFSKMAKPGVLCAYSASRLHSRALRSGMMLLATDWSSDAQRLFNVYGHCCADLQEIVTTA